MPHQPRRLEFGELPDRGERVVQLRAFNDRGERWLRVDHQIPTRRGVQVVEDERRLVAERLHEIGVELCAAALAGNGKRRVKAAGAPKHLDHVGQVDQPRADRDLLAAQSVGALAVPALVALLEACPHWLAETETGRQLVSGQVVAVSYTHLTPPTKRI